MSDWDVLVIGAGHAGCEAAAAAARRGARVALLTLDAADPGTLSCNPAVGGIGKGHLVREVDALGGLIGRVADAARLQSRLLNRSKGPAVHGPRAQVDRRRYRRAMQARLAALPNLCIVTGRADGLLVEGGVATGVTTLAGPIHAKSVVITTGTFLGGVIHRGAEREPGGRADAPAGGNLGEALRALGLPVARLKTGTPPRLDGRTIDWARVAWQPGDADDPALSGDDISGRLPQLPCGVTRTTAETHAIIRANLGRSALYGGHIDSVGPRYCPSIEDKVVRFGDRDSHQIFLEPEGYDDVTIYPNGLSTSLPAEVQAEFIATLPGLQRAAILRPGYAIEYDHVDPRALTPDLAVHGIAGLYLAGQINGTTGYEEAAAQGLVAGANAAAHALGLATLRLDRANAYIGVMIDDLVHQGVSEPYRMFTSRAEYRLRLRADNADERLTPNGIALGLVPTEQARTFDERAAQRQAARDILHGLRASPAQLAAAGLVVRQDGIVRSAFEWLRFPAVTLEAVTAIWPALLGIDADELAVATIDARYASYVARQDEDVAALGRDEALALPSAIDFTAIPGLSIEMAERLACARPLTLGAAGRVPGVTPAALAALLPHVRRAA